MKKQLIKSIRAEGGPILDSKRQNTDLICLIIFILFSLAMLILAIFGISTGNFNKFNIPFDPDSKGCGLDYAEYPLIYFASPQPDSLWVTTCVRNCPKEGDLVLECQPNSIVKNCSEVNSPIDQKAVVIYDTQEEKGNICIPTNSIIRNKIQNSDALHAGVFQEIFTSLLKNWQIVFITIIPVALILSLLFIGLVRLTSGLFVYLFILLGFLAFLGFGIYMFINAGDPDDAFILKRNQILSIVIGVVSCCLSLIICLLFCCLRRRVHLAYSIIKISVQFAHNHCQIILLSFALLACLVLFVGLWLFETLCFISMASFHNTSPQQFPFQHFQTQWFIKIILIVHIFYLSWGLLFFVHVGDFIVSGTAANWYFKRQNPLNQSIRRFASFHIGSVCLGSFLTALLGILKFLYENFVPIQKKQKPSACLDCLSSCCNCLCCLCSNYLFSCFSGGAYTFMNITGMVMFLMQIMLIRLGQSFCDSSWESITMELAEPQTTTVVGFLFFVTHCHYLQVFEFFVTLIISLTSVVLTIVFIKNMPSYNEQAGNLTLIIIVAALISFTLSQFFVSIYSESIQAIYVCFLFEKEGGRQNNCPQELREFLKEAKLEGQFI